MGHQIILKKREVSLFIKDLYDLDISWELKITIRPHKTTDFIVTLQSNFVNEETLKYLLYNKNGDLFRWGWGEKFRELSDNPIIAAPKTGG